jgi:putative oligomerization/nucleic acid binding protein
LLYGEALRREREILEQGVPAKAFAKGAPQLVPGDKTAMWVLVEVQPPDGAPYEVDYVFHAHVMEPAIYIGGELPVTIHPTDPSRIAVRWEEYKASVAASGGDEAARTRGLEGAYERIADKVARQAKEKVAAEDPTTRIKKLADMRDAGLIANEEFEAKQARLLAEPWTPPPAAEPAGEPRPKPAPVPPAPPPPPARRKAGHRGAGVLGRVVDTLAARPAGAGFDRYGRFGVPCEETLELPAGRVRIYWEDPHAAPAESSEASVVPRDLVVSVREAASGEELPLSLAPFGGTTSRHGDWREAVARSHVGSFDVPQPGRYTVVGDVEVPRGDECRLCLGL